MRSRFIPVALGGLYCICGLSGLLITGCEEAATGHTKIWGLPLQTLERRLASGNWEFLTQLNYDTIDFRSIERFRPGASYYLAMIYAELELPEQNMQLLVQEWNLGQDPWRRLSGLELMRRFDDRQNYQRLAQVARQGVRSYPNDPDYRYYLLKALYWQEQDSALLKQLPAFRRLVADELEYPFWRTRPLLSEAALWQIVAAERADDPQWPQHLRRLFVDHSASEYHQRLFLYLRADEERVAYFADWELQLFEAKHLLAGREYRAAFTRLEAALDAIDGDRVAQLFTERMIRDMGLIYFRAGQRKVGIERLQELYPQTENTAVQGVLWEWIGRFQQALGQHADAAQSFDAGFAVAPSDRLLWLHLNALLNVEPAQLVARLATHARFVEQQSYFVDLFDRLASRLVAEEEWHLAWQTLLNVEESIAARDRARFAVIVGEAVRTGRLQLQDERTQLRRLLADAQEQGESIYYAMLADILLDGTTQLRARVVPTGTPPIVASAAGEATAHCLQLVKGYLYFGMKQRAYSAARGCGNDYPTVALVELAGDMHAARMYREELVLMERARRRSDFVADARALRLIYPRAFAETVATVVRRYDLPEALFYGLVREESYFAPAVISHAGAVGLTQLMPATAADAAVQMGIRLPELTEPASNLDIGGFHFAMLLDRLDEQPIFALSAYNAGIGRTWRWRAQQDTDSLVLFQEAIPLAETRNYTRKILVSGAWYASLYADVAPDDFTRSLFPSLRQLP